MFVDGVEVLTANLGVSPNALRDIHIGSGQDDGRNFYWNGQIDDVIMYDEALSAAQIQNVMTNSVPEPSSTGLMVLAAFGFVLRRRR
jgi:hypothetical protein